MFNLPLTMNSCKYQTEHELYVGLKMEKGFSFTFQKSATHHCCKASVFSVARDQKQNRLNNLTIKTKKIWAKTIRACPAPEASVYIY